MGCKNSRPDPQPATGSTWWNRYDELAATVIAFDAPSAEQAEFISKCTLSALEPRDATNPPLLALAKDHDEWFRCLIKKCDPGVTWKQGGVERTLRKELIGHRNYGVWCTAMEKWNAKRGNNGKAEDQSKTWGNERWWSEFGVVSLALGLTTAAVGTVGTGGAAAFGFPVVAVGHVIWTVIKKWHNSIEQCGPSLNLKDIFSMHANVVGSILKELNTRIETAEKAVRANPGDLVAEEESTRQRVRVDALRALLEEDTEKMDSIVSGSRRRSDRTKYDEMLKMLRGLLDFQRRLHTELMEEKMSENLGKAVNLLENIEDLLRGTVPRSRSLDDSRTRSLRIRFKIHVCSPCVVMKQYLDSCEIHGRAPERTPPSVHRSNVGTVGFSDNSSRASGVYFCEACSSSLHSTS